MLLVEVHAEPVGVDNAGNTEQGESSFHFVDLVPDNVLPPDTLNNFGRLIAHSQGGVFLAKLIAAKDGLDFDGCAPFANTALDFLAFVDFAHFISN